MLILPISGSVVIAAELLNAALAGKCVSDNSALDYATVSKVVVELETPISMQLEFQGKYLSKTNKYCF